MMVPSEFLKRGIWKPLNMFQISLSRKLVWRKLSEDVLSKEEMIALEHFQVCQFVSIRISRTSQSRLWSSQGRAIRTAAHGDLGKRLNNLKGASMLRTGTANRTLLWVSPSFWKTMAGPGTYVKRSGGVPYKSWNSLSSVWSWADTPSGALLPSKHWLSIVKFAN